MPEYGAAFPNRDRNPSAASATLSSPPRPLYLLLRAALARTAFEASLYGAPFAAGIAVLFGVKMLSAFPSQRVFVWMAVALTCNALRLVMRWHYLRAPARLEDPGKNQRDLGVWVVDWQLQINVWRLTRAAQA